MKAILLSLLCSLMLASGQVFWKLSLAGREISLSYKSIVNLVFSPMFLAGVVLYGLATVLWIYLLSKFELSYIYPMIAFAYVFGAFLSVIVLKETISLFRLSGILLVVIGIAVIGLSK
jgi:drug/metabolite transporter (DMT)-like permease